MKQERSLTSGTLPMCICRSKRPGLIKAGSKISTRLVPARTTTLVLLLNPVMSETQSGQRAWTFGTKKGRKAETPKEMTYLPTVHFHEQLVEGVFLLVLVAKVSIPSLFANRVDLINEKDARGIFPSCGKRIPYLTSGKEKINH